MDIDIGGAVTYQPNDDQLSTVNIEFAAFDGEVGIGQLPIPDPTAALAITTGSAVQIDEIGTRITDGFVLDFDRNRGPQPAASAIVQVFSLQDANALLHGFRLSARTRPSETDVARVLAFQAIDLIGVDTTWVINASTYTMPAKVYSNDGGWDDLINDVVEFTGKTLFLHDKAGGGRCLHYHVLTDGHPCGLSISDDPSAVNGTTVFAPGNPIRQRTSVDLVNNVLGRDQDGRLSSATDSGSVAAHNAGGLFHEALIDFDATSQGDLDAKTAAFLASYKDDLDTYTCTIGPLDATALSLIRVGDQIELTSVVWGLSAATHRISHMSLSVFSGKDGAPAPGLYDLHLEMGQPVRRRARIKPSVKGVIPPGTPGAGGDCCPPWDGIGSPTAGQSILQEFVAAGDGVTTSFMTAFPYVSNTLRVYFNSKNVTSTKTEDDPTTGAFSVSTAPTAVPLQNVYVSYYVLA